MTQAIAVSQSVPVVMRKAYVPVVLVILCATLLSLPELAASISSDTAIYAYIGRALAHGKVLYRDVWDFKAPGIYYFFASLLRIFPDSLTTLRITAIVLIDA